MFYSIYRNGIKIGEKKVKALDNAVKLDVFIEINIGTSQRIVEASIDKNGSVVSFNIVNDSKRLLFDQDENRCIYSNQKIMIDEIVMVCYEKIKTNY